MVVGVTDTDTAPTLVGEAEVGEREGLGRRMRIGRYLVLESAGHGAVGHVLRAYDPKLRREVALKLLYATPNVDAQRAIVREAQAMAQLSHPNIVAVHDVEDLDERPYMTMAYVEGTSLREWLSQQTPGWREVQEVFLAAGRGLAAAHRAGIVHRDFKPANVMRSRDGRVQVTDFGIACEMDPPAPRLPEGVIVEADRTVATQGGMVTGTPAYMAPEQHQGRLADAKSDQYAFCVAMWEALAGTRPFAGPDLLGAKQRMEFAESDATRSVPRHLDRALRRGLDPSPDRRHASMEALLAQIGRGTSRIGRVVVIGGLGLALLGGWQLLDWQAHQQHVADCEAVAGSIDEVWGAEARDRVRRAFEGAGLGGSEFAFEQSASWLDRYAEDWTQEHRSQCLATEGRPEHEHQLAAECFEHRRQAFAALVSEFAGADAKTVRRSVRAAIGLPDLSPCLDEDWLRTRPAPPDGEDERTEVVALRQVRSEITAKIAAGRFSDAGVLADETLVRSRALGWSPEIAEVLLDLAEIREALGDYQGARDAADEALTLSISAGDDATAMRAAARLVYVVGYGLTSPDEALRTHALGMALAARLGLEDDHPRLTPLLNNVAVVHWARGAYPQAEALHQRVIAIKTATLGRDHLDLMGSLSNLGIVQATVGDSDGAQASFSRALDIAREHLGDDHLVVASALSQLGALQGQRGRPDEGLAYLDRALEVTRNVLGDDHPDVGFLLNNTGFALIGMERYEEAMTRLQGALAIETARGAEQHPAMASTLGSIARIHREWGELDQALELQQRALKIREDLHGPDHPDVAASLVDVAELHLELSAPGVALPLLERVVDQHERGHGVAGRRAYDQFALARALWDSETDRTRAIGLATHAAQADAWGDQPDAASRAQTVEQWLSSHRLEAPAP